MKDEELESLLSILDGAGAAQNIKEQQGLEGQEGQVVQLTKRNQHTIRKTTAVLTGHLDGKKAQEDVAETIKTYTLRDGTTYTGEMKDGKRHGQGTQTMIIDLGSGNEDYTYTGEWKDGMPHEGTWEYPNGNIYTGEFFEAVPHGQGTLTLPDGVTYTGEWKKGNQHGPVTWTHPDGYTYNGDWQGRGPHGHGTMTYPNGWSYTGWWKDMKRHGQGTVTDLDGSTVTVEYKEGVVQEGFDVQIADTSIETAEAAPKSKHTPVTVEPTEAAPKGKHTPVTAEPTEKVTVTLSGTHKTFKTESGDYRLERYKDNKIKAFKDDEVCSNTKNVLRAINKEYKLGFTSDDFKKMHTRKLGKEIITMMIYRYGGKER